MVKSCDDVVKAKALGLAVSSLSRMITTIRADCTLWDDKNMAASAKSNGQPERKNHAE